MKALASLPVVFLLATLCGCAPFATYPPDEGAVMRSVPREPVPTLMASAIRHASRTGGGPEQDFAVNLPAGTPAQVYDKVFGLLGTGRPMTYPGEPAYHVTKVRVRGTTANVDIFYPTADGAHELATYTFTQERPMREYQVTSTRVWSTAEQPPPPGYVARGGSGRGDAQAPLGAGPRGRSAGAEPQQSNVPPDVAREPAQEPGRR
jgi:hypothetical protein